MVPAEFGIAGEAFLRRAMQLGDISDEIRGKTPDGVTVPGIWHEVRCVLAFPMLSARGDAFGTVNFDSNKTAKEIGFDQREVQDILASRRPES